MAEFSEVQSDADTADIAGTHEGRDRRSNCRTTVRDFRVTWQLQYLLRVTGQRTL
jgi:hypothetical protein